MGILKRTLPIVIVVFILSSQYVRAACVADGANWASTPDYTSVASCVSQADEGDTVTVSVGDGSETWTTPLVITKGIKIIGPGKDNLTITWNGGDATIISWTPDATARTGNNTFRFSGFTIDVNNVFSVSTSIVLKLTNATTTPSTNVIIDNNSFKNIDIGSAIWVSGSIYGVAYSNIFDRVAIVLRDLGNNRSSWDSMPYSKGDANNFFFEDNTIQFSSTLAYAYQGWIEGGHGGRYTARYNSWNMTNGSASYYLDLLDAHGNQPGGLYATMGVEIYGNTWTGLTRAGRWLAFRGGEALMYNNSVTTTGSYVNIQMYDEYDDPVIWPCNDCVQYQTDSYFWLNYKGSILMTPYKRAGYLDTFSENTDFFNYTIAFNGTVGMGCGPLANLPGTCTTGVGYWATDQSCSDLTGMVGTSPATPISGTLYKCTATNTWTPYYTPYTYPHPLRGETDTTAPTVISSSVDTTGLIATVNFSENVDAVTKTGMHLDGSVTGAFTATYKDGMPGGIVRYDLNKEAQQGEALTSTYATPGTGIKDLAGNALVDFTEAAVTNNSTQTTPPLVTLAMTATNCTVQSSPAGINCGATCSKDYDNGTVVTLTPIPNANYQNCVIGGTGCGTSTTMSDNRTCTATCSKIAADAKIGTGSNINVGAGANIKTY